MLTDTFLKLVSKYTQNKVLANDLWLEIFTKYSEPKRHYHTISHLENIIDNLKPVQDLIVDPDCMLFSVFYHDLIYRATSSTNEKDSAEIAANRLTSIGYPVEKIKKCHAIILATKLHQLSNDTDTDFLIDADLAILGGNQDVYQKYTEDVRKEYSIYPDIMYVPGRRKVLQHFLSRKTIFITDHFINNFEKQARINLQSELDELLS